MRSGARRERGLCVLAVDVGNTSTGFGLFAAEAAAADAPLATWELTTPSRLTADEARMQVAQVLAVLARDVAEREGLDEACTETFARSPLGAILSCVVPSLTDAWVAALATACKTRPLVVGPGLKSGMRLAFDDSSEVGSDRIADALAARAAFGAPVVAVDFGTTVNVEVVDERGAFAGGIIAPGLTLGARALNEAAARLPMIELRLPRAAIGRNTREAMRSGVVFGELDRLDGLLERVFSELGREAPVVLTGAHAAELAPLLAHEVTVDEALTVKGLHQLYLANAR